MATCNAMCPSSEIDFRSKNSLIDQLEATMSSRNGPRSKYVADNKKMVKEYSRSAADTHKYNKPELLRPFSVLMTTVDYLLELYSPFKDRLQEVSTKEFSSMFSFVSDRFRSVRQDMVMQNMRGMDSVALMEKMLPFYVETDGLCKMRKCCSYNPKLHDFQLEECFGRWYEGVTSSKNVTPDTLIAASYFFRQLHRKPTLLQEVYFFREKLPDCTFSLIKNVILSFQSNNYYRFFLLFKSLDSLLQYSLSDSVSSLRHTAMRTISTAFKTPVARLPSRLVSDWLGFERSLDSFVDFLQLYSVIPDADGNIPVPSIKIVDIPNDDLFSRQY
ncbi:unnamed protein product [Caenorhabditis brenneri]